MGRPGAPPRNDIRAPSVALVSMPFHRCLMPPIGLGLLKAALSASHLASTVYNFNLAFLPELGETAERALEVDGLICEHLSRIQADEWLFAPEDPERDERYLALLANRGIPAEPLSLLRRLRARLSAVLDGWAARVVGGHHDIVGFSTSFGRTRANIRLAEAIRRLAPDTRIVLGGFAASGDMGRALLEAFPVVDLVCHTEADELMAPIVRALRGEPGWALAELRGISYRQGNRLTTHVDGFTHPDMEHTPLPDYDEYFEDVRALRAAWDNSLRLPYYLPIETARGCWWGSRRHCAFCSLNGDRMAFRAKTADRVLSDLDALHARYGVRRFVAVDNIFGHDYFRTLLPRLAERRSGYLLEWEVRPNLGRARVAALADAGVTFVQPGIESLSTPALRVMNKGTTAIENIETLKWLMARQIRCSWNFLYCLPGERLEWYAALAPVLRRLMHLGPPTGLSRIELQRYGPHFAQPEAAGIRVLGPVAALRLAFGDVPADLVERFAYDFDYEVAGRSADLDHAIVRLLAPLLEQWRDTFDRHGCTLSWVHGAGESLLIEGPLLAPVRVLRVRGLLRRFLKGCETIQPERDLLERLERDDDDSTDEEAPLGPKVYRRVLADVCFSGASPEDGPEVTLDDVVPIADARGWIYREAGRLVSLPVDQTRHVQSGQFELEAAYRRFQ